MQEIDPLRSLTDHPEELYYQQKEYDIMHATAVQVVDYVKAQKYQEQQQHMIHFAEALYEELAKTDELVPVTGKKALFRKTP